MAPYVRTFIWITIWYKDHDIRIILDLLKFFVADANMKRIQKFSFTPSQSTFKYGTWKIAISSDDLFFLCDECSVGRYLSYPKKIEGFFSCDYV